MYFIGMCNWSEKTPLLNTYTLELKATFSVVPSHKIPMQQIHKCAGNMTKWEKFKAYEYFCKAKTCTTKEKREKTDHIKHH